MMRVPSLVFRHVARAFALGALVVPAARAQGALGVQGFGYPGGELSTRALSTGGSLAEFDPQSPLNPAALGMGSRALLYVQYDPEFRTSSAGGLASRSTIARFPMFGVSARAGQFTFGLSFSSYLDRTWSNAYADTILVGGTRVASNVLASSSGGITDVRGAAAWTVSDRFVVGLAVHVYPGRNNTSIGREFVDSSTFGGFNQSGEITYAGSALSLGLVASPVTHLNIAASGRLGGPIDVRQGDSTVLGRARVPARVGASLGYDGIAGSMFTVHWSRERFGDLKGLGTAGLNIQDATEVGVGAEVSGPKVGNSEVAFRVGARQRDLPFDLGTSPVKELSYTGGLGIPVAAGKGMLDIGIAHAHRTTVGATETGWVVSVGLSIRP
jgi:hypothetical protein